MIGEVLDIAGDFKKYDYDQEKAKKLLADSGWGSPDDKGVLNKTAKAKSTKDGPTTERLTLRLTTPTWSELTNVANLLKEQWAKIGIELVIEVLPTQGSPAGNKRT